MPFNQILFFLLSVQNIAIVYIDHTLKILRFSFIFFNGYSSSILVGNVFHVNLQIKIPDGKGNILVRCSITGTVTLLYIFGIRRKRSINQAENILDVPLITY